MRWTENRVNAPGEHGTQGKTPRNLAEGVGMKNVSAVAVMVGSRRSNEMYSLPHLTTKAA